MLKVPSESRADAKTFDAFYNLGSLVEGGRVAANWLPDGRFWFVENAPADTVIRVLDPATGEISDMFDVARVRASLGELLGRPLPYAGLPFESFRPAAGGIAFTFEGKDYRLDTSSHAIEAEPVPNQMEAIFGRTPQALGAPRMFKRPSYHSELFAVPEMTAPDGRRLVGLENHNLVLHYAADGRVERLTDDGEAENSWDVESIRMGMAAGGSFVTRTTNPWSPDGLRIFATKFDARGCGKYTRTHLLKRYDDVEELRVSRTGDAIPIVEPYVIDVLQGKKIRIGLDTENHFLLFLGWQADGRRLFLALYSRDMREAAIYAADPETGEARLLHKEAGETFVRVQHQVLWGRPGCTLLADGSGFLWESEGDGWNHLYRYDMDGKLLNRITSGDWPVLDVLAVDLAAGQVWFTAHHDQSRPYDVHLCRAPLGGGETVRLTPDPGVHEIQLAPDFRSFVATRSMPDLPPRSEVRRADGALAHAFPPADVSKLEAMGWTPPEQFCVKAADGVTDLWGVIFKPPHFDPAKSYPVLEYIYGGPQIVNTPHNFHAPVGTAFGGLHTSLPCLGYLMIVLDARGTPERSKAFQDVVFREWRRHVTADHAAAIRNLAADRPWMDLDRVGLWGHSWGGYFTFACMIDQPDLFRVGVASAPGFDPYDYFIHEPYFGGVPGPDNVAAYQDALLYPDAPRLAGDLMLVAGSSDISPWHNAFKMTNELLHAGIEHEFVLLPGQIHGYDTRHEAYFVKKLISHFDRFLRGDR